LGEQLNPKGEDFLCDELRGMGCGEGRSSFWGLGIWEADTRKLEFLYSNLQGKTSH